MKKLLIYLPVLLLIIFSACNSNEDPIVGKWIQKKNKSVYFEFTKEGKFDIKNSNSNNSILGKKYNFSIYEQNGKKKIKYTQTINGKVVNTRHEIYQIENDVLKLESKAYSHRGSKSWFESYYRKK